MQNKKLPKCSPNEITKLVMAYMEALKKKKTDLFLLLSEIAEYRASIHGTTTENNKNSML